MSKSTSTSDTTVIETISRFDDGMTSERNQSAGFTLSTNLRHYKDRVELSPKSVSHTGMTEMYAITELGDYMYALGTDDTNTGLFRKTFNETAWTYLTALTFASRGDQTWLVGIRNDDDQDWLYYLDGNDMVRAHLLDGGTTDNEFHQMIPSTKTEFNVIRPFIHPTSGYMYFFERNNGYELRPSQLALFSSGADWDKAIWDIPAHLEISSACPYGDYIAIFCHDHSLDKSYMYLWDKDLGLEDFTDIKEWGDGEVYACATIGGNLFGVSLVNDTYNVPSEKAIKVSYYAGNSVEEITSSAIHMEDGFVLDEFPAKNFHPENNNSKLFFAGPNLFNSSGDEIGNTVYSLDKNGNVQVAYQNVESESTIECFTVKADKFHVGTSEGAFATKLDGTYEDRLDNTGTYVTLAMDANERGENKSPSYLVLGHSKILNGGSVKVEAYNDNLGVWTDVFTNTTEGETRTLYNSFSTVDVETYFRITLNKVRALYLIKLTSSIENDDIA